VKGATVHYAASEDGYPTSRAFADDRAALAFAREREAGARHGSSVTIGPLMTVAEYAAYLDWKAAQ
jgi:hypothetical protein